MSSGSDIRDNIQARCRHASRLPDYRTPFGARPTESNVDLFFDAPESASNVTLCYTYGLYKFQQVPCGTEAAARVFNTVLLV